MTLILVSNSTIKMLIINSPKGDLSYGNEIVHCKCLMSILPGAPDYTLFFYGTTDKKFMMP